jgi:hypothetical protein
MWFSDFTMLASLPQRMKVLFISNLNVVQDAQKIGVYETSSDRITERNT